MVPDLKNYSLVNMSPFPFPSFLPYLLGKFGVYPSLLYILPDVVFLPISVTYFSFPLIGGVYLTWSKYIYKHVRNRNYPLDV